LSWAEEYTSTLETTLRYTVADAFETFPLPRSGDITYEGGGTNELDDLGNRLYEHRTSLMAQRAEGITRTYNRFHDPDETNPDIQKLRQLHVEMDNAVAAAYGWTDLDLGPGFHETKQGIRYTISEAARREVLARLLKLNHERYAEEVKQGLHEKKKAKPPKKQVNTASGPTLYDKEADE
jgi:hypothetical protein